jgi:hypothetical protein
MNLLFLLLLLAAAVCFGIAAFGHGRSATRADGAVVVTQRVNFVALGLLFWVLVPLIQHFN